MLLDRSARLRRLCPLAVLRGQMPLLRLQQPCPPPAGRPGALCRAPSRRNWRRCAQRTGPREVTSIFLGGGTPSLMKPETVAAVLDAVAKNWTVPDGIEMTLEANPSSVEAERFRGYRAAGVNRVSLGVQALNDTDLRFLGRLHNVDGGAARDRPGARNLSAPVLRPDLCAARPDAGGLGGGARTGDRPRRRPSVALPADDRGRHALPRPARGAESSSMPDDDHRGRPLRADAGDHRRARPAGLRDFQPCQAGRGKPPQPDLLALRRICRRRSGRAWPLRRERPAHR